jgi:hypothetical protein
LGLGWLGFLAALIVISAPYIHGAQKAHLNLMCGICSNQVFRAALPRYWTKQRAQNSTLNNAELKNANPFIAAERRSSFRIQNVAVDFILSLSLYLSIYLSIDLSLSLSINLSIISSCLSLSLPFVCSLLSLYFVVCLGLGPLR